MSREQTTHMPQMTVGHSNDRRTFAVCATIFAFVLRSRTLSAQRMILEPAKDTDLSVRPNANRQRRTSHTVTSFESGLMRTMPCRYLHKSARWAARTLALAYPAAGLQLRSALTTYYAAASRTDVTSRHVRCPRTRQVR